MTQTEFVFSRPAVRKMRASKRRVIEEFFRGNPGVRHGSGQLHARFGPAFRSRVSEVNRDRSSTVTIRNQTIAATDGSEHSVYWGEVRQPHT